MADRESLRGHGPVRLNTGAGWFNLGAGLLILLLVNVSSELLMFIGI